MGVPGTVIEQGDDVKLASGRSSGLAFPCRLPSEAGTSATGVSACR
mgnify:CR=1 FL=1